MSSTITETNDQTETTTGLVPDLRMLVGGLQDANKELAVLLERLQQALMCAGHSIGRHQCPRGQDGPSELTPLPFTTMGLVGEQLMDLMRNVEGYADMQTQLSDLIGYAEFIAQGIVGEPIKEEETR